MLVSLCVCVVKVWLLLLLLLCELQGYVFVVLVGVLIVQGIVWFEFDIGNGGIVFVLQFYVVLFDLDLDVKGEQIVDFDVVFGLYVCGCVFMLLMIIDGNFGMLFLYDKIVMFDLVQGWLWIQFVELVVQ